MRHKLIWIKSWLHNKTHFLKRKRKEERKKGKTRLYSIYCLASNKYNAPHSKQNRNSDLLSDKEYATAMQTRTMILASNIPSELVATTLTILTKQNCQCCWVCWMPSVIDLDTSHPEENKLQTKQARRKTPPLEHWHEQSGQVMKSKAKFGTGLTWGHSYWTSTWLHGHEIASS